MVENCAPPALGHDATPKKVYELHVNTGRQYRPDGEGARLARWYGENLKRPEALEYLQIALEQVIMDLPPAPRHQPQTGEIVINEGGQ